LLSASSKFPRRNLRYKKRTLIPDPDTKKAFSIKELVYTLQSVILRKAAGFDGIYPEIFNSGRRTKEWIVSFFIDILSM
jgi:hypothetical protein